MERGGEGAKKIFLSVSPSLCLSVLPRDEVRKSYKDFVLGARIERRPRLVEDEDQGVAQGQGPPTTGPICPDALADNMVKLNLGDLEALFNGVSRALAKAGVFTAMAELISEFQVVVVLLGLDAGQRGE